MTKKLVILLLLLMMIFVGSNVYSATDWSQFESNRNNIGLDGFDGQPGYIKFTDGDGTTIGYLYASSNSLYWATVGDISLSTTKLGDQTTAPTKVDN